ncbi:MAG TPA: AAA domain-containing protein [Bacteroidales bacterium]|nr:AAA domain-containing protein [Bacteroidales bacterium]
MIFEPAKNKAFISILKKKLSTGTRRSIYLRAAPAGRSTRLELNDLKMVSTTAHYDFINDLLTKKNFKVDLKLPNLDDCGDPDLRKVYVNIIRKLKNMTKQNKDYFLEHGIEPFGFGYPLIMKRDYRDPEKHIIAPLVIWNMSLEEDRQSRNRWIMKREEEDSIYFNRVLLAHLENDADMVLPEIPENYLSDYLLSSDELSETVHSFMSKFQKDIALDEIEASLFNLKSLNDIENRQLTTEPLLLGAGVFGLYVNTRQSIIRDVDSLLAGEFDDHDVEERKTQEDASFFASVELDPSQQCVIHSMAQTDRIIIHGPPGTGKSQSLTAVISNAAAEGKKVLVVCQKRTALDVIYNNLKDVGLERLCALIEDTSRDRRKTINKARETIDNVKTISATVINYKYDPLEFERVQHDYKQAVEKIRIFHQVFDSVFSENLDITDMTGFVLQHRQYFDKEVLDILKAAKKLEFNGEEYRRLFSLFQQAASLLKVYDAMGHPLEILNYNKLSSQDVREIQDTFERIPIIVDHFERLSAEAKTLIDDYRNAIIICVENYVATLKKYLFRFNELYEQNRLKKAFASDNMIIRVFSFIGAVFSSVIKRTLHNRNVYFDLYKEIIDYMNKFPFQSERKNGIINEVEQMFDYIDNVCRDEIMQLLKPEIFADHILQTFQCGVHQPLEEYDLQLDEYCERTEKAWIDLKESEIFLDDLDFPERVKDIAELFDEKVRTLVQCHEHRGEYDLFLEWHAFYDQLHSDEKSLISNMSKIKGLDLITAFRTWYFDGVVNHFSGRWSGNIGLYLNQMEQLNNNIRELNSKKALAQWQDRRVKSIFNFNRTHPINAKQLFSKTSHKRRKKTLREIIAFDFQLFTDIFPVMLVNPSVCSSLFALKKNLFDVVIFDEASQLRLEETFPALLRGRIKIISGDEHQMPPSDYFDIRIEGDVDTEDLSYENETTKFYEDTIIAMAQKESLLEFASENRYENVYLDFHYRSRHPALIEFSNAAFYRSRLSPLPPSADYKPIRYIDVNGVYENRMNIREALQVVKILREEIRVRDDGLYPSVGIATFNVSQRNLIWEMISEGALNDRSFGIKVEELLRQGLFIKNLENIQGDERDIMILSTTFGCDKDGNFSEHFGPINIRSKGHRLLNVLITRAKERIYICTSIPEERTSRYNHYLESYGIIGRSVLFAYLAYSKAIELNDMDRAKGILESLSRYSQEEEDGEIFKEREDKHAFAHYVAGRLIKAGIDKNRIELNFSFGGYSIPLLIRSLQSDLPFIAIECDGSKYALGQEAHVMDITRRDIFTRQGLSVLWLWSRDWWFDEETAFKKLLESIDRADQDDDTKKLVNNQDQEKTLEVTQERDEYISVSDYL